MRIQSLALSLAALSTVLAVSAASPVRGIRTIP